MMLANPGEIDPGGHDMIASRIPMSVLNMALLSVTLVVAHTLALHYLRTNMGMCRM